MILMNILPRQGYYFHERHVDEHSHGVHTKSKPTNGITGKKRVRCTADRPNDSVKKRFKQLHVDNDCKILRVDSAHESNRIEWPEYRYHQIDETWQRNACNRMGLRFVRVFNCQSGGAEVILRRPDLRTLHDVQGDGNCLFRAMSFVITGCESQHMEIRNAI